MADEATTTATETTSEETAKTTDTAAGAGTQTATTEAKTFTQAELDRIVKQRLKEEKQRLDKAAADAQLPEIERLKRQLQDLETEKSSWAKEKRERDGRDTVIGIISADKPDNPYRAKNPSTVYKLIKDDLEYSDDGKPANHLALLKALKADDPTLFGPKSAGSVNGGDGANGSKAPTDMNAMIRQHAGRA